MKEVLHIVSCLKNGGTEKVVLTIAKENYLLQRFNMSLFVLGDIDDSIKKQFEDLNVTIIQSELTFKTNISFFKYFNAFLRKNRFDVIHSHINLSNCLFMVCGAVTEIPVRTSHAHSFILKENINLKTKTLIFIQRFLNNIFATDLVAPSNSTGRYMFGKAFDRKGKLLPNTIDIKQLRNLNTNKVIELKKTLNIDSSKVIGCIGRFDNNKNQLQLLHCFEKLTKTNNQYKLLLIGNDAGTLNDCKQFIDQNKLSSAVIIIDAVTDLQNYYALCNFVCVPSLSEGFSLVSLEAQALSIPVIANNSIPRDIDLNLNLINFIDFNNSNDFIDTINSFAKTNTNFPQSVIDNKLNEKGFQPTSMFSNLLKIYDI